MNNKKSLRRKLLHNNSPVVLRLFCDCACKREKQDGSCVIFECPALVDVIVSFAPTTLHNIQKLNAKCTILTGRTHKFCAHRIFLHFYSTNITIKPFRPREETILYFCNIILQPIQKEREKERETAPVPLQPLYTILLSP